MLSLHSQFTTIGEVTLNDPWYIEYAQYVPSAMFLAPLTLLFIFFALAFVWCKFYKCKN